MVDAARVEITGATAIMADEDAAVDTVAAADAAMAVVVMEDVVTVVEEAVDFAAMAVEVTMTTTTTIIIRMEVTGISMKQTLTIIKPTQNSKEVACPLATITVKARVTVAVVTAVTLVEEHTAINKPNINQSEQDAFFGSLSNPVDLLQLFEFLPEVYHYVKDREGRYMKANRVVCRVVGVDSDRESGSVEEL